MQTEQSKLDEMNAKYFQSGWDAALREVIATDKHKGPKAAVKWAKDHTRETQKKGGK